MLTNSDIGRDLDFVGIPTDKNGMPVLKGMRLESVCVKEVQIAQVSFRNEGANGRMFIWLPPNILTLKGLDTKADRLRYVRREV